MVKPHRIVIVVKHLRRGNGKWLDCKGRFDLLQLWKMVPPPLDPHAKMVLPPLNLDAKIVSPLTPNAKMVPPLNPDVKIGPPPLNPYAIWSLLH